MSLQMLAPPAQAKSVPDDFHGDRLLSLDEVLGIVGLRSKDSLYRAERRGRIKLVRLSPKHIGMRASELRRWLDDSERRPAR